VTLTSPSDESFEAMSAAAVGMMLAKGPALGPWLATLDHPARATAVAALYGALNFSEVVYTTLLFRPTSVIMVELNEATFTAGPTEVYVNDETILGL